MLDALIAADRALFSALNGHIWPGWMDAFFVFITEDEGWPLRLILLALFVFLLLRGPLWRRRALWLLLLIALGDFVNSQILKEIFERARPCHQALPSLRLLVDCGPGYSFPSSHAANMGALGVFLALGLRRPLHRFLLLILPVLVAYSRVHVGVHWPLDVVSGFLLGGCLAWAADAAVRRLPDRWGGLSSGSEPSAG